MLPLYGILYFWASSVVQLVRCNDVAGSPPLEQPQFNRALHYSVNAKNYLRDVRDHMKSPMKVLTALLHTDYWGSDCTFPAPPVLLVARATGISDRAHVILVPGTGCVRTVSTLPGGGKRQTPLALSLVDPTCR